jgi:NAD(P)H-hydrate epimerase
MLLTRDQARALDARAMQTYGIPGIVLMENAGRNMAELLLSLAIRGPVAVCCGKGNNGGDGFVIARYLDNARIPVRVFLFADPQALIGDAAIAYRIIAAAGLPVEILASIPLDEARLEAGLAGAEWIVDGLFGTGLQGAVRPPFDRIIEAINTGPAKVFAIDIPSGLDCDTGRPLGPTVRAQHTATVAALKKGFVEPGAEAWLGKVHVVDFGAPRKLFEEG